MKKVILKAILEEQKKLDKDDVQGHVWWNKFFDFVDIVEDPTEEKIIEIDVEKMTVDTDTYKFDKKTKI